MNASRFEGLLTAWLADSAGVASDRVVDLTLEHVRSHPRRGRQRSAWRRLLTAVTAPRRLVLVVRPSLVLAAVALAAAIAGGAWVGAHLVLPGPQPTASPRACPVGSDPDRPGPMDQERPPTSLPSGPLVVDWHAHLLVQVTPDDGAFNSEHPVARDATLWTFDLCTNTWERRRGGLTTGALAYDAREDRIVIIGQASVTVYDLRTDTYEVRGSPPLSTPRFGAARSWRAVYDTERQRVLVLDKRSARVWSYDTAGDRWAVVGASGDRPPGREGGLELVAYDGSVDRLVLYAREGMRAQTFELDLATGTWSQPDIATPLVDFIYLDSGDEGIGYDPSSERTLVFSSGRVIAYDAHARAWAILYDEPPFDVSPASRPDAATTFDPVNRRLVVVGGWMGRERDDVIAFDPRSLSWSTLLEQSEP